MPPDADAAEGLDHWILLINCSKQSQDADVEISPPLCLMLYYLGNCCIFLLGTIFQLDNSSFENNFWNWYSLQNNFLFELGLHPKFT